MVTHSDHKTASSVVVRRKQSIVVAIQHHNTLELVQGSLHKLFLERVQTDGETTRKFLERV